MNCLCTSDLFPKLFCFSFCQSAMTVQTDGEGGGFMTDSTIADTTSVVSVQSSVSTRSSRSGLTRQGNHKRKYCWSLCNIWWCAHIKWQTKHLMVRCTDWIQFKWIKGACFCSFLSSPCLPRINIQALELWEEVRKGQDKEKTQEDCCGYPTACSDGTRYAAHH